MRVHTHVHTHPQARVSKCTRISTPVTVCRHVCGHVCGHVGTHIYMSTHTSTESRHTHVRTHGSCVCTYANSMGMCVVGRGHVEQTTRKNARERVYMRRRSARNHSAQAKSDRGIDNHMEDGTEHVIAPPGGFAGLELARVKSGAGLPGPAGRCTRTGASSRLHPSMQLFSIDYRPGKFKVSNPGLG